MACLRCGKKESERQVFCNGCLSMMDLYPVKPGTQLNLPSRNQQTEQKKPTPRRQAATLQVQLRRSQELNVWLGTTVAVLTTVLGVTVWLLM